LLALQLPTHNNITLFSFFFFLHYNIVYSCSLCSYSLRSFLHLSGTTHRTLLWPAFAFLLLFRPFFLTACAGCGVSAYIAPLICNCIAFALLSSFPRPLRLLAQAVAFRLI
jgi:hypothetical protein